MKDTLTKQMHRANQLTLKIFDLINSDVDLDTRTESYRISRIDFGSDLNGPTLAITFEVIGKNTPIRTFTCAT